MSEGKQNTPIHWLCMSQAVTGHVTDSVVYPPRG